MPYANNKGADQPALSRSLISTFVVSCLDSMICVLAISQNFKILASFCSWAGWFESKLVESPRRHIFAWCGSYIHVIYHLFVGLDWNSFSLNGSGCRIAYSRWFQYLLLLKCLKISASCESANIKTTKEIILASIHWLLVIFPILCVTRSDWTIFLYIYIYIYLCKMKKNLKSPSMLRSLMQIHCSLQKR